MRNKVYHSTFPHGFTIFYAKQDSPYSLLKVRNVYNCTIPHGFPTFHAKRDALHIIVWWYTQEQYMRGYGGGTPALPSRKKSNLTQIYFWFEIKIRFGLSYIFSGCECRRKGGAPPPSTRVLYIYVHILTNYFFYYW